MRGNPWDGRTLDETLESVVILADAASKVGIVDKGTQGVHINGVRILRSGQKRGMKRAPHAMVKRRSAVKAAIGNMKSEGRTHARGPLNGTVGTLCARDGGTVQSVLLLLKNLRLFCARIAGADLYWLSWLTASLFEVDDLLQVHI